MGLLQPAIVIILTLVIFHSTSAQSGIVCLGARAQAMGNASVALEDNFSPFNNIGASSSIEEITAISSFSHKFGFSPFQHFGAGILYPVKSGVFSLTIQRFGADLYNEQHLGVGFSNKFGMVSLGLKIDYTQFTIQETGTKGVPTLALGGIVALSPTFTFGAHIYNLTQAKLSKEEALYIPVILKSGICYKPINALIICLEVEKDVEQEARIKGGLEYKFLEKFFIRSGISSAPFQQHYGLGFSPANFSIDYALENHNVLGLSHQISIAYKFYRHDLDP